MPNSNDKSVKFTPSLKELKRRNQRAAKGMKDMITPHKRIAVFLDQWVQRNFKTEGGKVGGWKPLSDSTVASRRQGAGAGGAKILQDTGRLRLSFLPFASKSRAGIGSDLPYSKIHEKGINVQMRRMLTRDIEVSKDIERIFNGHVSKNLKKLVRP
jgi:phage gpG-like protein